MCPPELTESPIGDLRRLLEIAMDFSPPRFDVEFAHLERETKKLRSWLGGQGVAKPSQDASRAALRDFVRVRDLPTLKQATLTCFGCTDPFDDRPQGLIADDELFPLFLDRVDDYRDSPRALRLCYRGLLHAYFQYDVERGAPPARDNWGRLRTYLENRTSLIATPGFQPSWVGVLHDNPEALGPDPGAFYGSEVFRGRPEKYEQMRMELPISDASWLVWRVIVGQIDAATQSSDEKFRAALPNLLTVLERHPAAKTFGLSKLLFRYRQCASPTLHEELRDFAVGAWGNPWLALNDAAWSLVPLDARTMVADWLKLALMQKFFGLLAEDGLNDTRRLKFWESYHQCIHAMYFALGETARSHRGPDFRQVRKQMEGLQLTLTASTARNNAFIMCIGEHVIVEFGEKGNACFIFHKDRLPFKLEGEVAGNSFALKHLSHVSRLLHTDSTSLPWEEKFSRTLSDIVKVKLSSSTSIGTQPAPKTQTHPTHIAPSRAASTGAAAQTVSSGGGKSFQRTTSVKINSQTSLPLPEKATFTMTEFKTFTSARHLATGDIRRSGGNLWVFHRDSTSDVAEQLLTWGFRFKPDRGWWFK
jgi:hypothetical protein